MTNFLAYPSQLFRIDQLVGCGNLLSFLEWLSARLRGGESAPFSLLSLDINGMARLNASQGHLQGDAALRWIGLVLADETHAPVYRTGGDEFVVILEEGSIPEHEAQARRVYDRLNGSAREFGLEVPPATITLLNYRRPGSFTPGDVFIQIGASIDETRSQSVTFKTFNAGAYSPSNDIVSSGKVANFLVQRMVGLGSVLDESHHLAYTDPVTGMPNMRLAQHELNAAIARAPEADSPFSVLLIDGDDLRKYNKISYAAGDEMIQRLAVTLENSLRPADFLARWRVGDEFFVILPETRRDQAVVVAERLCQAVRQASQEWPLPVSISIGVAEFSGEINTMDDLLERVGAANARAKEAGKDRVVADP
jgi:diguanylate cyclase (GGDEF)-like protein